MQSARPKPPSEREPLAGLVERVTFHNADNGFCVLRVKARGHRDLVTQGRTAQEIILVHACQFAACRAALLSVDYHL